LRIIQDKVSHATKKFIEELKESGIIDAIGDAISIQDTDFAIIYQNKRHEDIVGDKAGEKVLLVFLAILFIISVIFTCIARSIFNGYNYISGKISDVKT
jgi:PAS domain-containing protein